jgi:hypothetical protein
MVTDIGDASRQSQGDALADAGLAVLPERQRPLATLAAKAGRLLRWLAAVDEHLLRWAPTDKAKYTALGGVVLGTAVIATLSMTTALSQVRGGFHVLLLLPALIWGVFVCNLDRWLVSTSAGARWHRRATILLPRMVLAFLFGCVIAEPLVLKVFESAIEKHIKDERQADLRLLASTLLRCNPDPTAGEADRAAASGPECADYQLSLQASFAATNQELASRQREADTLRDTIATDREEQARRDILASNECAGTAGPGTTGRRGRGAECTIREREAEDYRESHPAAQQNARLEELSDQISTLQAQVNSAQQDYQGKRDTEVQQKVDERAGNQGPIGLLERFSALDRLTADNAFLFTATWFIRLFFIVIDCLPVLVKFIGGVTKYEELVDSRLAATRRVFEQGIKTSEAAIVGELKTSQEDTQSKANMRRARIQHEERWHQAELDVELDKQIDELAERLNTSRGGSG